MELSRRERGRPSYVTQRSDFRRINYSSPEVKPSVSKPLGQLSKILELARRPRILPNDSEYSEEESSHATGRGFHPYQKNSFSSRMKSNVSSNNIPSLLDIQPLVPPKTLDQLQSSLHYAEEKLNTSTEEWEYGHEQESYRHEQESYGHEQESYEQEAYEEEVYEAYDPPSMNEQIELNEYLREEEETKQKIEEIIIVAQALREKLEKEEEIRRTSNLTRPVEDYDYDSSLYESRSPPPSQPPLVMRPSKNMELTSNYKSGKIPRLMDLKPKIPSLMDIYVEPPPVENVIKESILIANSRYDTEPGWDLCWNCDQPGHRYVVCQQSKKKKFCFRCGRPGFDVSSCPYCKVDD